MTVRQFFFKTGTGLSGPVSVLGLVLLLVAPLIRGGNRHVALLLIEGLALLLLVFLAAFILFPDATEREPDSVNGVSERFVVILLALSPLWIGIVQLTPLPPGVWVNLPGRDFYVQALSAIQMSAAVWRPISLMPDATWLAVLAGLPLAAAFLMAYLVTGPQLTSLLRAIMLFAFLQALLGLLQVSLFRSLYFDAPAYGRAIGTFANPNHLASYLAMSMPLTILALRQALRSLESRKRRRSRKLGIKSLVGKSGGSPLAASFWGVALVVQVAGLVATQSRGGIATAILTSFAAVLLLPVSGVTRKMRWRLLAGAVVFTAAVMAAVGFDGIASRVADSVGDGSRWEMIKGTWRGAMAFFPFGAGLGTFSGVFPRFQPEGFVGYASHAHSDYLQLFMEAGVLFIVLFGAAVWLVLKRIPALVERLQVDPSDQDALTLASCGLGLLAVFLHSWVDFNLRIPANAMLAVFLLGVVLRPLPYSAHVASRGATTG
mgnify:CR=1 FL=1